MSVAARLETFSYLPQLTADELARQIAGLLARGLIPAIEHARDPRPGDHYWAMWKLPLFEARAPGDVLAELAACRAAHPDRCVRVIGYDRRRQGQAVAFVAHRPGS